MIEAHTQANRQTPLLCREAYPRRATIVHKSNNSYEQPSQQTTYLRMKSEIQSTNDFCLVQTNPRAVGHGVVIW